MADYRQAMQSIIVGPDDFDSPVPTVGRNNPLPVDADCSALITAQIKKGTCEAYETFINPMNGRCASCGEDNKKLVFEYGILDLHRLICDYCYLAWMDRKFKLQTTPFALEALHGKTRET